MKTIRIFDIRELEEVEKYFAGNSVEAPPEYAKEIAAQAIRAMIENQLTAKLTRLSPTEEEQIRKVGFNEGWADGTKALLEVMTGCFTG